MQCSEFDAIAKYFAPLAGAEGLNLSDDTALFAPSAGKELVITSDAITAGIHFYPDDAADHVAQKLLRVNLSDLAAKGARPRGYLLCLLLPETTDENWLSGFVAGLLSDQTRYGIRLFGGDTSRINGPLTATVTAIGEVESGTMIRRSGAQMGDLLYMTGGLGNAGLGLKIREGELDENEYLLSHYLHPYPRLEIGQELVGVATSCIDISDGLVQDAGHLAKNSQLGLTINTSQLTFSREARDVLKQRPDLLEYCLNCGDDYELLFTAPPEHHDALIQLSERVNTSITAIGAVHEGSGVTVLGDQGEVIDIPQHGWQHF